MEQGGYASDLLRHGAGKLSPADASLAHEIVFGVLRRRPQLDFLLQRHLSKPLAKLDLEVLTVLRAGAYQLLYLERIPAHAAVSESVLLTRAARKASASGLVNAVLRKVAASGLPDDWPDRATALSMPEWILRRWESAFGATGAARIAEAFLHKPDVYTRLPRGKPPSDYPALEFVETEVPGCLRVLKGNPQSAGLRRTDSGSQWVATRLDVQPGDEVLDLCAAPGNKTAILAETGRVVAACDASFQRLAAMKHEAWPKVRLDAARPLPFGRTFRRILLDAPCSGTGTLGRNPEIRWRITPEKLREFPPPQSAMLRNALDALAPGGVLVYATCSLEIEENENIVRNLCHDYEVETARRTPGVSAGDGFFAAVIRKPSGVVSPRRRGSISNGE